MRLGYLERIGGVKTARMEGDSILLARALLCDMFVEFPYPNRLLQLVKMNKVLLRASSLFPLPAEMIRQAKDDLDEAFQIYELMSAALSKCGVTFVSIKSFDSLPDFGHDVDLLVPVRSELIEAKSQLLRKYRVHAAELTHCDKLVGKFSCFLPGYKLDFELYPDVSQLGENYLDLKRVIKERRRAIVNGREVWIPSSPDRITIRLIHSIFRHRSIKLSDILDFLNLIQTCDNSELMERVEEARINEAFLYYLSVLKRFLDACKTENLRFDGLLDAAKRRFGNNRLELFERDRLVLPFRVPTLAIVIMYLFKSTREASANRWRSSMACLAAPPLLLLEFVASTIRSGGRGGIW